jgi:hypothetical protein
LLARAIVITRRATGIDRPIVPTITLGGIEIDILSREVVPTFTNWGCGAGQGPGERGAD